MDEMLTLVVLLLCWRVALCVAVALSALALLVPANWTSVPQAIGLVLAATMGGWIWDQIATRSRWPATQAKPAPDTPASVLALSFGIAGLLWGALSTSDSGSGAFGFLLLLAVCAGLWYWQSALRERPVSLSTGLLCFACALAAYCLPFALL